MIQYDTIHINTCIDTTNILYLYNTLYMLFEFLFNRLI